MASVALSVATCKMLFPEPKDQFGAFFYEVTIVKVSSLIKELTARHDDLLEIGPKIDSIESLDFFSHTLRAKILKPSATNSRMTHWPPKPSNLSLPTVK